MKLRAIGLALGTLIIVGGGAAMADTTIVKTESVGLDMNAVGGTDDSGSGGLRGADSRVVIEKTNCNKTTMKNHHTRRAAYNSQIDLALPSIN